MILTRSDLTGILGFALIASIVSLAAAFIAQYGFGLAPCELCLLQRVPYALVIILAISGLWRARYRKGLVLGIGALFVAGACIASYHAAVEKQWVKGPVACTDSGTPTQTVDDFLKKIQAAPIVACDKPAWDFYGLTMAGINAVWSFMLALLVFAAMQHIRRRAAHA